MKSHLDKTVVQPFCIRSFPLAVNTALPVTLTLKNVSPLLHRKLKDQARRHKRSLNQEAILCLERAVSATASAPSLADPPPPVSVGAILRPFATRGDMLEDFLESDFPRDPR